MHVALAFGTDRLRDFEILITTTLSGLLEGFDFGVLGSFYLGL